MNETPELTIRPLEPTEFYLVNHLLDPNAPPIDPDFSRIIAAFDATTGEVVGIVGLQLVLHAEPIIISPKYRGTGAWRPLAEYVDGYLYSTGIHAAYHLPGNPKSQAISEKMGYKECKFPLYMKQYRPIPGQDNIEFEDPLGSLTSAL